MNAQTESRDPPAGGSSRTGREQAAPGAPPGPAPADGHPTDALREAVAKLAELREFAAYYVAARIDAIRLTVRNIGIYAGLAILGLVAVATILVVSVALLLLGIAGAWGELFAQHKWLGDIITAVIFLGLLAGGVLIGMRVLTGMFKTTTVHKYESRQRQQRQQFGRDVRSEAAAPERRPGGPH